MHPIAFHQRTLGELRGELATRLGFISQGQAAGAQRTLLNSFLQEAHAYVAMQLDDPLTRQTASLTTSPGESLYDWQDTATDQAIDPARVQAVGVLQQTQYQPLIQGISDRQRAACERRCPSRYDAFSGQLLLWPTPDARYHVQITYTAPLPRFTQDADRPAAPDQLVFLYALATAKAHDRHADAAVAGKAFETLLSAHKSRQHGQRRYFVKGYGATAPHPFQVVRTAQGYFLMNASE